jgi:hypothetical protein
MFIEHTTASGAGRLGFFAFAPYFFAIALEVFDKKARRPKIEEFQASTRVVLWTATRHG